MRSLLSLAVLLAGVWDGWPADPPKRPSIRLIYADDQSYKTVGCYVESWPWVKTPSIDALAKSGARFHGAYPSPRITPDRLVAN